MRYLVLSDIHSNLEALESCLELADGKYDAAVCLGDLVGYGPDPNAVVARMRQLTDAIIRGNHDKACAGLSDAEDFNVLAKLTAFWTRQALTPETYAERFRGSAMKRAKLPGLQRNARALLNGKL